MYIAVFASAKSRDMLNKHFNERWHCPRFRTARETIVIQLGYSLLFTTVFVDTRLWKTPAETFPKFRSGLRVIDRSGRNPPIAATSVTNEPSLRYAISGCDWWLSIRSVNNMQDIRKFLKRFRGCFVFQSRASMKTVVRNLFPVHVSTQCVHVALINNYTINTLVQKRRVILQ